MKFDRFAVEKVMLNSRQIRVRLNCGHWTGTYDPKQVIFSCDDCKIFDPNGLRGMLRGLGVDMKMGRGVTVIAQLGEGLVMKGTGATPEEAHENLLEWMREFYQIEPKPDPDTLDMIRTIHRLYNEEGLSQLEIALQYDCDQKTISRIIRGETYDFSVSD